MSWCKHCREVCPVVREQEHGYICERCGKVLDQASTGQSRLSGTFMRSMLSKHSLSVKKTLMKGAVMGCQTTCMPTHNWSSENKNISNDAVDELESFSDVDDVEVSGYLHNEAEKHFKKIIWEKMNKEYLEEQAAKEAAAAAAAKDANYSENVYSAQELAAAATAAVASSKKKRKPQCIEEAKRSYPAKIITEATHQTPKLKNFSSRINYKALNALYKSKPEQETVKKHHVESNTGDDADEQHFGNKEIEKAFDSEVEGDDNAPGDIFEEDHYYGGEYDEDYNYGNEDECKLDFY